MTLYDQVADLAEMLIARPTDADSMPLSERTQRIRTACARVSARVAREPLRAEFKDDISLVMSLVETHVGMGHADARAQGMAFIRAHGVLMELLQRWEEGEPAGQAGSKGGGKADAAAVSTGLLSPAKLAEINGLDPERLRKRLERWRFNNGKGWMEVGESERGPTDPKYLYDASAVSNVVAAMKGMSAGRKTSGKRPAGK